jgi:glycosyltransferase involved in cell wall biosynthesis
MEQKSSQRLLVFMTNYDWGDVFRVKFNDFANKLRRDALNFDGNDFFVFSWTLKESYRATEGNVATRKVHVPFKLPTPLLDLIAPFVALAECKRKNIQPDCYLCHSFGQLLTGWFIRRFHRPRMKIILLLNNLPEQYGSIRSFGTLKRYYNRYLEYLTKSIPDAYMVINDTVKGYLEHKGIPATKIFLFAMNTINRERDLIAAARPGTIRQRFNLPADANVIVSVGRLEVEKRHELMLQHVATLDPSWRLFILGEGSLRGQLEYVVNTLGLQGRVYMPGLIPRTDIWNYYVDADVFALLSRAEALGVVFWEAMHVRVPVIGSDEPGIIESLGAHGERGIILKDGGTDEEFRHAIARCTSLSSAREAMIAAAHAFVAEKIANDLTINDVVASIS